MPVVAYGNENVAMADPWHVCVESDRLYMGNLNFGPGSQPCREYLTTYCSEIWDEKCERYATNRKQYVPDEFTKYEVDTNVPEGQKFLRGAGAKKYCKMVDAEGGKCAAEIRQFDENVPNSPSYMSYYGDCDLVCDQFDENSFVDDPVIDLMLNNPQTQYHVLMPICSTIRQRNYEVKNPRLKAFCDWAIPPTVADTSTVANTPTVADTPVVASAQVLTETPPPVTPAPAEVQLKKLKKLKEPDYMMVPIPPRNNHRTAVRDQLEPTWRTAGTAGLLVAGLLMLVATK